MNIGVEIRGVHSVDIYELPLWSVREMIANAVVHRSYLVESCVQVSIYDDRIEVDSPGMLYDGIDIEKAMSGVSRCRNSAIAEAFRYMKIIDKWGTGIPRILEECKEYELPNPKFQESGDCMKFIMYRKSSNAPEKSSNAPEKSSSALGKSSSAFEKKDDIWLKIEEKLLDFEITKTYIANIKAVYILAGNNRIFRQADIMEWLHCSKSKAGDIIRNAKKAGVIGKVSGHGQGFYMFNRG